MTAVLYDEVVWRRRPRPGSGWSLTRPRRLCRRRRPPSGPTLQRTGGDPLVDGAARLLSVPLRQLYAALWRAGVIEVGA